MPIIGMSAHDKNNHITINLKVCFILPTEFNKFVNGVEIVAQALFKQ